MTRETISDSALASNYLALCQPEPGRYTEYLERGERLLALLGDGFLSLRFAGNHPRMNARIHRRRSLLFGRDYFLAWVPTEAFDAFNGPNTDATAEIDWPEGEDARPPLIIVPLRYRTNRSLRFVSILEHETIHINQVLSSHPLLARHGRLSTVQLVTNHFAHTKLEFLANFIQGARWPHTIRSHLRAWSTPLALEQWSLLRGYTQALEHLFGEIARGRRTASGSALRRFLDTVPAEAAERLEGLGLSTKTLEWFRTRWRQDVERALELIVDQRTGEDDFRPLRPVHEWTKKPPEPAV